MLWVCIDFPGLPLEVFHPPEDTPCAVEYSQRQRRLVLQCNRPAQAAGITPGMSAPSAQGLCDNLRLLMRDPLLEQRTLERMALLAYQFSPYVCCHRQRQILLEVESCLRLFGGCQALLSQLGEALTDEGLSWQIACFPTARGASILAIDQGQSGQACIFPFEALAHCQLIHAELPASHIERMRGMGFTTLGDLFMRPTEAIARRFGQDTLLYLRQLQGLHPDLRPHYQPPDRFDNALELGHDTQDSTALLFPLKRLLTALEHYLQARQSLACTVTLELQGRDGWRDTVPITPARGVWRQTDLLELFRLRFEKHVLVEPVTGLRMTVDTFAPFTMTAHDLFSSPIGEGIDADTLVDRLRARLGHDSVNGLRCVADHRPERAWQIVPPGQTHDAPPSHGLRPLWLLDPPRRLVVRQGRPCDGQPLTLLQGPERLDSGWWDDARIHRDYYIALHAEGSLWWVFRPADAPTQWFLHGFFT